MEWKYSDDKKRIVIKPPKQRLRITGHRISTILGLNKWSTPFQAWCEITKLLKAPFEETKYIIAGRVLEPKIIEYVASKFPNVVSIEDYYGVNFDKYRYNNFVEDSNVFGGVIDAVSTLDDLKTITMIVECKTSSKPQDWVNNQVPIDYLLQGALYSYMKGLDRVMFACTFLDEMDYAHPEKVEISEKNTILVVKKLKDILIPINGEYLTIDEVMSFGNEWWNTYIESGVSPEFDEKADKEYLEIIRASKPCEDNDLIDVCEEALKVAKEIKELEVSSGLKAKQELLKVLESSIKEKMIENQVDKAGKYTLKKVTKLKLNEKELEKNDKTVYDKYIEETVSYTLSKNMKEDEEDES